MGILFAVRNLDKKEWACIGKLSESGNLAPEFFEWLAKEQNGRWAGDRLDVISDYKWDEGLKGFMDVTKDLEMR